MPIMLAKFIDSPLIIASPPTGTKIFPVMPFASIILYMLMQPTNK